MSEEKLDEESSKKRKYLTWDERINGRNHKITPRIKRFIYEYVSAGERLTLKDFAKRFKVSVTMISTWLAYPVVKEEINRLLENQEERMIALLESRQEQVIKGMLEMFNDKKINAETRRKIGYNLLSFGRLKDVNKGRTIINQQQAIVSQYASMTDEQLAEAIKEMDELENG